MDHNDDNNSFVFGDDLNDETSFHKMDAENRKIDKLSNRLTFMSIIIPVILLVIIGFAYFDIKNSVVQVSDTGSKTVKDMSSDVQRLISSLKIDNAKFQKDITDQVNQIKKQIQSAEKDINFLSAIKINKKQIEPEIKALEKSIADINKSLEGAKKEAKTLEQTLTKTIEARLGDISAESQSKLFETESRLKEMIESRVSKLDKAMARQSDIDTAVKKQRIIYQVKLDQLSSEFNDKLNKIKFGTKNTSGTQKKNMPASSVAKNDKGTILEKDL